MSIEKNNSTVYLPLVLAAVAFSLALPLRAQQLSGDDLVNALQAGGYVIVMRHAQSALEPPAGRGRAARNVGGERQLDEQGQIDMTAMGFAFRELRLPVGETLSSPAYRAIESAQFFGFGDLVLVDALAEPANGGDPAWLRAKAAEPPPAGENTVVITHQPNIAGAFGGATPELAEGESLIFRPAAGGPELVAKMTIRDWAILAVE